jgi:hypothetical protein
LPLSEKARIEMYLLDVPRPAYQEKRETMSITGAPMNGSQQIPAVGLALRAVLGLLFGALWSGVVSLIAVALAVCTAGSLDAFLDRPPPLPLLTVGASAYMGAASAAFVGSLVAILVGGARLQRRRWRSVFLLSACGGASAAALGALLGMAVAWGVGPQSWVMEVSLGAGAAVGAVGGWYSSRLADWVGKRNAGEGAV